MSVSLKILRTSHEFAAIKDEWLDLEKRVSHTNLSSSYTWLFTWWSVFYKVENNEIGFDKELLIECLYENETLIAVAPFVKVYRKKAGLKISFIEFLGQQWGAMYLDIVAEKISIEQKNILFEWLYKNVKFDVLFLKYIPQYSNIFELKNLHIYHACPYVNLSAYASFEEYKNKVYSKNLKQNLRTALNRMEKNKDAFTQTVEEMNESNFKDIVAISKSKLEDNKNWVYEDENKLNFYKKIYYQFSSNISLLKINGKNVAYRTNILFNNHKFCIDASYNRQYNKYELGALSVDLNLRDSFEKKLAVECMGPGVDLYKFKFTKEENIIYVYIKRGNTFLSTFLFIPLYAVLKRKGRIFVRSMSNNKGE